MKDRRISDKTHKNIANLITELINKGGEIVKESTDDADGCEHSNKNIAAYVVLSMISHDLIVNLGIENWSEMIVEIRKNNSILGIVK